MLRGIELAASNAARGAGAGLAAGWAALALSVAPPPASLVPPVRQEQAAPVAERPADESPAPDARERSAADPVIDDGPDPRPSPEPTDPIIEPGRARQPKPAPDPGDDPIVVTAPPGRNPPTPKPSDPPPEEPPGRAIAADARARRGPPTA